VDQVPCCNALVSREIFISVPFFLVAVILSWFFAVITLLVGMALAILILGLMGALLSAPTFILRWVVRGRERQRERKIGWIGFGALIVGFFIQAAVNLMP
jgi:hypothetical protein